MAFACSICGEESTQICARCTKDACDNHLCAKCHRCSDCCECEVALEEHVHETVRPVVRPPAPEPEPEPVAAEVAPPPLPDNAEIIDETAVVPPPIEPFSEPRE
jgi:hypothetical protein